MMRKISQRNSQMIGAGGGRRGNGRGSSSGTRKIARTLVSSSWISQPYPYQSWPILTKDRYRAQSRASRIEFAKPASRSSESPTPSHDRTTSA
jgi:hypothetical protein